MKSLIQLIPYQNIQLSGHLLACKNTHMLSNSNITNNLNHLTKNLIIIQNIPSYVSTSNIS